MIPPLITGLKALAQRWASVHPVLKANELLAVWWNESSGNPDAYNPGDPSWGLGGVSPLIAHAYGGFGPGDDDWKTDPDKNAECSSGFLADLKTKYSAAHPNTVPDGTANPTGWVAAYNEGEPLLIKHVPDPAYVTAFLSHLEELNSVLGEL